MNRFISVLLLAACNVRPNRKTVQRKHEKWKLMVRKRCRRRPEIIHGWAKLVLFFLNGCFVGWYTGVCVAGGPGARRLGAGRLLDTQMQVIIFLSIQYRYLFDWFSIWAGRKDSYRNEVYEVAISRGGFMALLSSHLSITWMGVYWSAILFPAMKISRVVIQVTSETRGMIERLRAVYFGVCSFWGTIGWIRFKWGFQSWWK